MQSNKELTKAVRAAIFGGHGGPVYNLSVTTARVGPAQRLSWVRPTTTTREHVVDRGHDQQNA
jgi:hypothetical protein